MSNHDVCSLARVAGAVAVVLIVLTPSALAAAGTGSFESTVELQIAMDDSADPVGIREQFSYLITVTNVGPSPATGVEVSDALPAVFSIVSVTSTQGSCTSSSPVSCSLGTLQQGDAVSITIAVFAFGPGDVSHTANVSAAETDVNPGDNSSTESTEIVAGSVAGTVFADSDGDGRRDAGEAGMSGVTVHLGGGEIAMSAVTDGDGGFSFDPLPAGSYEVSEVVPSGWTRTVPAGGSLTVAVGSGESVTGVEFGNHRDPPATTTTRATTTSTPRTTSTSTSTTTAPAATSTSSSTSSTTEAVTSTVSETTTSTVPPEDPDDSAAAPGDSGVADQPDSGSGWGTLVLGMSLGLGLAALLAAAWYLGRRSSRPAA